MRTKHIQGPAAGQNVHLALNANAAAGPSPPGDSMADITFVLFILAASLATVAWYCVCVIRLDRVWDQCERDHDADYWSHHGKKEQR